MHLTDSTILKISIIISTIGIGFLLTYSIAFQPIQTNIEEITFKDIGTKIAIEGKITKFQLKKNTLLFWITKNETTIQGIKFNPTLEEITILQKKEKIKIIGTIQEYKGQIEIITEKIEAKK